MKSFLSRFLKFIIAAVVALAVIIVIGVIAIGEQVSVERMQSTYTLTDFDYIVTSPSDDQVNEYNESSAVENVFAFYNVSAKLTGVKTTTITVLGADSLDNYDIGFFNKENCISGEANSNGIMLDETAANGLGVTVGDTVRFTYVNKSVTVTVSGIYLACTYKGYDEGLALMVFDDDIKSASVALNYYQGAFIQAASADACAELLSGYIPWARFYSTYGTQDEYVAKYLSNQPVTMTEAQWQEHLISQYEEYYENWASKTYTEITSKSEQFGLISDKIDNAQASVDSLVNTVALSVTIAFAVLMIIFIMTNAGNDKKLMEDGVPFGKLFGNYLLLSAACPIAVALIGLLVLWLYSGATFFVASCTPIALLLSLPVLIVFPVAAITSFIYLKVLYK